MSCGDWKRKPGDPVAMGEQITGHKVNGDGQKSKVNNPQRVSRFELSLRFQ